MSEREELLTRVQKATGPDREIDGDIAEMFDAAPSHLPRVTGVGRSWLWAEFVEPDSWETWGAPEYTASIDAALALVERVLPGWKWQINKGEGCGLILPGSTITTRVHWGKGANTPLAILAALLTALQPPEAP